MARLLDNTQSEYLEDSSAVGTTAPMTVAGWGYEDQGINSCTFCIGQASSSFPFWIVYFAGYTVGDPITYDIRTSTGRATVSTSSGFTQNTWHHFAGVWTSATSHAVFIDGGSKGTDSTNVGTLSGVTLTAIGAKHANSVGVHFSGRLAELAIWSVALSDAEVALLAKGLCPLFIQPHNIIAYWKLLRSDNDHFGAYNMTPYNSPTWADHPPIFYLSSHNVVIPATAAGPVSVSPAAIAAVAALVDPTVVLSSLSLSPATVAAVAALVDPTVHHSSTIATPAAISAVAGALISGGVGIEDDSAGLGALLRMFAGR